MLNSLYLHKSVHNRPSGIGGDPEPVLARDGWAESTTQADALKVAKPTLEFQISQLAHLSACTWTTSGLDEVLHAAASALALEHWIKRET